MGGREAMKLYEVPRNTWIRTGSDIQIPPGAKQVIEGQILFFHHIDGMYSYCTNKEGDVIHLIGWAEVDIIKAMYKDGFYYRTPSKSWEIKRYGEGVDGKGDLISNTMMKIVDDNDTSDWAEWAFYACADLLLDSKRWPNRMNQVIDAKTWVGWRWSVLVERIFKGRRVKYRPQYVMTRDPYICFYTCAAHLGKWDLIEEVAPVWYIYRPFFRQWRKYLITKRKLHLVTYRIWMLFSWTNKEYVLELHRLQELAIKLR